MKRLLTKNWITDTTQGHGLTQEIKQYKKHNPDNKLQCKNHKSKYLKDYALKMIQRTHGLKNLFNKIQ